MFCDICAPKPIQFELRFDGEDNQKHLPSITRYVQEMDTLIGPSGKDRITVKEEAMKGLLDYMKQHMEMSRLFFRTDGDWKPMQEVQELLKAQWIDRIIDEEAVVFHAQPIVHADRTIYAHEMLARFIGEDGELIPPFQVFEKAKLRNRMFALDRVCRMNAVRQAAAVDTRVFINFIPTSIYSPEHCLRTTIQISQELNIDPSLFVFEVVETEQVKDLSHLKNILDYYNRKGFRYALDDVGAGFNTVETIQDMHPHYTKLDRAFVAGIHEDPAKQEVARGILRASREAGAIPLAEGIEEEEEFLFLKNEGFELFQGYLFGKPQPVGSALTLS